MSHSAVSTNILIGQENSVTDENIQNELDIVAGKNKAEVTNEDEYSLRVKFLKTKNEYLLYKEGKIELVVENGIVVDKPRKLSKIITSEDYGKPIDYKVTINGDELTNWKILSNQNDKVCIIYGDYIESKYVDGCMGGLTSDSNSEYSVKVVGSQEKYYFVDRLKQTTFWNKFATGYDGAIAYGSPTLEMINNHLERSSTSRENVTGDLLLPHDSEMDNCIGYWLAYETYSHASWWVYYIMYNGTITSDGDGHVDLNKSLRPVVILPSDALGRKNDESITLIY